MGVKAIELKTTIPHPQDVKDYATFMKYEARSMQGQLPIVWHKARYCNVWDRYGNKFLDFTSGIAVANAGHGNYNIAKGIEHLLHRPLMHSYTFATDVRYWFLRELIETCYPGGKAFLVSAGTEATEVACKLMRMYGLPKRSFIVSFKGAMHGRTSLAENLKGNTLMNGGWASKDWNVECMEFPNNNTPFLGFRKPEDVAGVIIESYQGWSARFFNPKFIQDLVKYCKEHDILVCFDEIQGGFGRTGKMFAYEHYGIERPDLICIGKGVSSSLPLSGVIGRADLIDLPEMGSMSSTHSANPLSCIAGLKNLLEIHDKHLVQQSHYLGDILHSFLRQKFGKKYEINGEGLLLGLITETEEEATQIVWECFKRGLLTIWTHKNSVKLAPPLTITEAELAEGLGVLNEVLLMRA